jgi:hypothetical protein
MTSKLAMECKDVSPITEENSPFREEDSPMSAVADVNEMQALCIDIADLAVGTSAAEKVRIPVLAKKIGVSTNRALEFLRAKARRVDSWEKDRARQIRDELTSAAQRRREHEHLAWLQRQLAGMDGDDVHALQHLLRRGGYEAGPMEVSEADADFDQREGWGR